MPADEMNATNASPFGGDEYCRAIESYLCRRNDGHLIRIIGPSFELVSGWGGRGVPLKVVYRGIDRYLERYYAKATRRRPVRIEFCEADVLDVFDEWRRAVGVMHVRESPAGQESEAGDVEDAFRHRGSLKTHLERAAARVGALRATAHPLDEVLATIEDALREMIAAGTLRGDARERAVARLQALENTLADAARSRCDEVTMARLTAEAEAELAPFRARMSGDAYRQSFDASLLRLLREHLRLPSLLFD
jgi:hypothetical protein